MGESSKWPRSVIAAVRAAAVIGSVGVAWLLAVLVGVIDVAACDASGSGSCGFVLVALGLGAFAVSVVSGLVTWAVVEAGRAMSSMEQLHRYGRWLSLRERKGGQSRGTLQELVIEVVYHDATGGTVAGIAIAYEIVGINPRIHDAGAATVVTDRDGVALIPVNVQSVPSIVTLHAEVPGNPAVKDVGGVFVVGVG